MTMLNRPTCHQEDAMERTFFYRTVGMLALLASSVAAAATPAP